MSRKPLQAGDYTLWYRDYKEPLEQLEGGFPGQPRGVLLAEGPEDDAKPVCAFCWPPKAFDNLGVHAAKTHGLRAHEYKNEVGLLQRTALVSEPERRRRIAVGLRGRDRVRAQMRAGLKREPARSGASWAPEKLNQLGTCYEQALAVARRLAAHGQLTKKSMAQFGLHSERLQLYFGGISGLQRRLDAPIHRKAYSSPELIALLQRLAHELGRTPSASDARRFGTPDPSTYIKRFGSWSQACVRAGLDPNIPMPFGDELDLAVLSSYAGIGNINGVAKALRVDGGRVSRVLHRYGFPFGPGYNGPGRREWAADMARRLAGTADTAA